MWRLAWRNLWRKRARTIITGTAVSLTLALQLVGYGINDFSYERMFEAGVRSAGGAFLVHADTYWAEMSSELVVEDWEETAKIVSTVEGVEAVIPRVIVTGLASTSRGNAGVRLLGIDPALEATFDDRARYLAKEDAGTFLAGPFSKRKPPVVLGRKTVTDLRLELGDKVIISGNDRDGQLIKGRFYLSGILDTGSDMVDAGGAYTTLQAAQSAFGLRGAVTQLGVVVAKDRDPATVRDATVSALGARSKSLEAVTWDEALPELVALVAMDKQMGDLIGLMIFLVVAFGIANTFLMSVMERVRELGLLGALGMTPSRVAGLVLTESLILAVLFIGLGVGLGYSGHLAIDHYGIDFAELSGGADFEMGGVILEDLIMRSTVDVARWTSASLIVGLLILLSALYPAFKATRLEPAAAMRTYE